MIASLDKLSAFPFRLKCSSLLLIIISYIIFNRRNTRRAVCSWSVEQIFNFAFRKYAQPISILVIQIKQMVFIHSTSSSVRVITKFFYRATDSA